MDKLCVIGAGSWGCALALELAANGNNVYIYSRRKEQAEKINRTKMNEEYLPGVVFPENIYVSNSLEEVLEDSKIVVLAVPSQQIRNTLKSIKGIIKKEQILVDVAKGLEKGSGKRISQICEEELPLNPYTILSGPSHAEEVSRDIPTTVVVAGKDIKAAETVRDCFMSHRFRVYLNNDVVGVELGGALKNIIAFGAGISDGIGYGDNAKAALMTRGLSEMSRLGVKMGASLRTFSGLAGIGDLIVTCTSMHSRNRRAGILIGQGKSLDETLKEVKMVVEGITATEVVYEISKEMGIEMPITEAIYHVIKGDKTPEEAVYGLMTRDKKSEFENIYPVLVEENLK